MKGSVLVVDDQKEYATFLIRLLTKFQYQTDIALNAAEARIRMEDFYPDVVLMDINLPDADGSELVYELKKDYPNTQFIIITGFGSIKSAMESAQRGAVDYLTKPCQAEEILLAIESAMHKHSLSDEVQKLRSTNTMSSIPDIAKPEDTYTTSGMKTAMGFASRAATQNGVVLLLGEHGCGKDHLGRWIHNKSSRRNGPFFSLNFSALTRDNAELELFGHEPGAYSDSRGRKKGVLELADKGTLLLNEISKLELSIQSKLLNYLDTKTFLRVGGEQLVQAETRIFAATSVNLKEKVDEGLFLENLYYRLNVFPITIPPLRERIADLPVLVREMLSTLSSDLGLIHVPDISKTALEYLTEYSWPGNVRELRNVLERTLMLSDGSTIEEEAIPLSEKRNQDWHYTVMFPTNSTLHDVTKDVARRLVKEALRRANTKQEAAKLLGLSRHALAHQIRILDL